MASASKRLRDPLVLVILVLAVAGWLAFLAMWINSNSQYQEQQEALVLLTTERDTLAAAVAEREAAEGSLAEIEAQITAAQQELAQSNAALETAQAELQTAQQNLSTTAAELEARRQELAGLTDQVTPLREEAEQLTAQLEAGEAQLAEMEQQLTDVGARLEQARRQEATITANVAQVSEEAATTTEELATTQAELQAAREQIASAQVQLADIATQTEAAGAELTTLRSNIDELEAQRAQLRAEVENYATQRQQLQPQVTDLAQTLASRSEELAAVERRIAEATAAARAPDAQATGNQTTDSGYGNYVSGGDSAVQGLVLELNEDDTFLLTDPRGRTVSGAFVLSDDQLVLEDGSGDIGDASFPMTCPATRQDGTLVIGPADECILSGMQFTRETPAQRPLLPQS
ncbi:hypothetical protein [Devosia sp. RR2S18]|uniref:hypothetical protein n=1 Tax=Devosia rhizosphaerae TaxID=3049774 RepID=UPI0025414236|nr:hypothetical protein [Devosia sp. RR2S18]WIJ26091.1 hypothetical protein QOV41_04805 [Devosia sp. RR2S18]